MQIEFQCLAAAGYIVAYFNQRGTTAGYGQAWTRASEGDQGGADFFPDLYGKESPLRFFRTEGDTPVEIVPTLPHQEWGQAWGLGFGRFLDAIRGSGTPSASGEDGLKVLRLLDAAYRSAAAGREIDL